MRNKKEVKNSLVRGLYQFELFRGQYGLCSTKTGFFQPFNTPYDVQQQIKTTLASPIIGLAMLAHGCLNVIGSLLMMGVGIVCLSPSSAFDALIDVAVSLEQSVVTPLVACAVTLGSLVSLLTRTIATIFSFDLGESNKDLLSFLPENPYAGATFSYL